MFPLVSTNRILTIAVIVLGLLAVSSVAYKQFLAAKNSYNSNIKVSFTRSSPAYDYSCDQNDYQIIFTISNVGPKNVVGLAVTITNPLCFGSIPPVPQSLNASSSFVLTAQTTSANGTLTITGNDTLVQVQF